MTGKYRNFFLAIIMGVGRAGARADARAGANVGWRYDVAGARAGQAIGRCRR
jgi:hypothetical protein